MIIYKLNKYKVFSKNNHSSSIDYYKKVISYYKSFFWINNQIKIHNTLLNKKNINQNNIDKYYKYKVKPDIEISISKHCNKCLYK